MKKFLIPLGAGVVVFGVATAFAASLGVSSSTLAAGNVAVVSCTPKASVSYATSGSTVTTATVNTYASDGTTPTTSCSNKTFQVSLLDSNSAVIATATGTFGASASSATTGTFPSTPNAATVENFSVVITG